MRRAALIAIAACAGVWALMRFVLFAFFQLGDTRVYEHASRMVEAGALPHRDFDVEYPPLATGFFWLVGRIPLDYQTAFSLAIAVCLAAAALAGLAGARRLGMEPWRQGLAVGVVAVTPVALGALVQTRYDLLLSALLGWVLVAALYERFGWAWTFLAVATAVKLVPIVLVPVLVIWHAHRRGRRGAIAGAASLGVAVAATLVPFFVMAPTATWRLFGYHLDRPLQIESLGSALIHAAGGSFASVNSYGSENVVGRLADASAKLSTVALVVVVVAIAWSLRRRLRRRDGAGDVAALACAFAATLAATVAFGKVISPQYMVWLLPAVLLIAGRRGVVAAVVLLVAMVLTQLVFPLLYADLVERGAVLPVWLLVARNALLLGLIVLAWPRLRGSRRTRPAGRLAEPGTPVPAGPRLPE